MAKLPTAQDLGLPDVPASPRPIQGYDAGIAQKAAITADQTIAQGGAAAGAGIEKFADNMQSANDAVAVAMGGSQILQAKLGLDKELETNQGVSGSPWEKPGDWAQTYADRMATVKDTALSGIQNPEMKARASINLDNTIANAVSNVQQRAFVRGQSDRTAAGMASLDGLTQVGAQSDDEGTRAQTRDAATGIINGLVQGGNITPLQGQQQLKTWTATALAGRAQWLDAQGHPDQALAFVNQHASEFMPHQLDELYTHLRGRNELATAMGIVNRAQGGGAPPTSGAPASSTPGGVDPGNFYSYLTNDLKASPNEATLLTSAASSESSFNPSATHDGGIGYGLFGHNGDRLAAMQQQAGTDKPGWQDQAKFALGELRSRPEGAQVNSATTPEQLTDLQMQFEQPNRSINNDGNYAGRLASTRQIMAAPPGQGSPQTAAGGTEVWGDSLGVGVNNVLKTGGTVHGGDTPLRILANIQQQPAQSWQGKSVILSSGTNGDDLPTVEQTVSYLKSNGANVAVVGFGSKYADRDKELQAIAQRTGAAYVASGANDGTHMSPAGYRDAAQRAQTALATSQGSAALAPGFARDEAGNLTLNGRPPDSTVNGAPVWTASVGPPNVPSVEDGRPGHRPDGSFSDDVAGARARAAGDSEGPTTLAPGFKREADGSLTLNGRPPDTTLNGAPAWTAPGPVAGAAPGQLPVRLASAPVSDNPPTTTPVTTPPISPAPGMADLANAEAELARNHANTIAKINSDPDSLSSPQAHLRALAIEDRNNRKKQVALTASRMALTEGRNAAADGYVQQMIKGPLDPQIMQQIAADPKLDATTRENLWQVYAAHTKNTADGDTAKYGPAFFDNFQKIHLPDDDPNKVRDPSQLYALATPKADGSQDLTLAGVDKLTAELRSGAKPETTAESAIRLATIQYAKKQMVLEYPDFSSMHDSKGEASFNIGFVPQFYKYWDDGIKAGKTPQQLADRKAIDDMITPLLRNPAELLRDQLTAADAARSAPQQGPPAPVPFNLTSPAALYLRANPDSRGDFDKRYGAGTADRILGATPPPAAEPTAPMAQP